jgi:adenylate kinase
MEQGGVIIDHHSSEFFQTDNTLLYDRLQKRGYADKKIQENVQCEIMHVPCEEAQRSYKQEVVQVRGIALQKSHKCVLATLCATVVIIAAI